MISLVNKELLIQKTNIDTKTSDKFEYLTIDINDSWTRTIMINAFAIFIIIIIIYSLYHFRHDINQNNMNNYTTSNIINTGPSKIMPYNFFKK